MRRARRPVLAEKTWQEQADEAYGVLGFRILRLGTVRRALWCARCRRRHYAVPCPDCHATLRVHMGTQQTEGIADRFLFHEARQVSAFVEYKRERGVKRKAQLELAARLEAAGLRVFFVETWDDWLASVRALGLRVDMPKPGIILRPREVPV